MLKQDIQIENKRLREEVKRLKKDKDFESVICCMMVLDMVYKDGGIPLKNAIRDLGLATEKCYKYSVFQNVPLVEKSIKELLK
jgi:hypothetical protein